MHTVNAASLTPLHGTKNEAMVKLLLDHGTPEIYGSVRRFTMHAMLLWPDIPRGTQAQNIAYLNQCVFGRENEHFFLRHIVGFIPRTRLEEGEEEEEEEEEGEGEGSEESDKERAAERRGSSRVTNFP